MSSYPNSLIGYWVLESDPENAHEIGITHLRFEKNGLMQTGNENEWRIHVLSYQYWIEGEAIATTCSPNPRIEFTPFSVTNDGRLVLSEGSYNSIWAPTTKKEFFNSQNIWDSGILSGRSVDYISLLDSKPVEYQKEMALRLGISPQLLVNTKALWSCWEYARSRFASFHVDDFGFILDRGVLVDHDDNEDRTLLSYLSDDGCTEGVRLLLDHGAKINRLDIYPLTALDYAVAANQNDTVALLRERGGKQADELD